MSHFICVTCGTQYEDSDDTPPDHCLICDDERQYVPPEGQRWTTSDKLREEHHNEFRRGEERLVGVGTSPSFAIGQRALLVQSPGGNILWDCLSLLDEFTERTVRDLGGIAAIAISHPHYYSCLADWAAAFDAPVYLHTADRRWVMRPSPAIVHWEGGELKLHDGMRLINAGGHFDGGTMLHVPFLAGGRGALLSGDIIQVIPDRRFVGFMYSYPNLIPLPADGVKRIASSVAGLQFDRIYGAWWDRVIASGGKEAVARSAERYMRAVGGS
ncbi:MBL fold metallo-hydrolase [bacterium]|nr:MAG: MBL fold metallo-hydrolase [bacterium]